MKCENCGAEYGDKVEFCPYCNAENVKRAHQMHREILEEYDKKERWWRRLPIVLGWKASGWTVALIIAFIVIAIIVGVSATYFMEIRSGYSYQNKQDALAELEILYEAGDYASMRELLYEQEQYTTATFGKYYNIGELHHLYSGKIEEVESSIIDAIRFGRADFLQYDIEPFVRMLCLCDEYEAKGYVYDEQTEVEVFKQKAVSALKDICLLEDDEIEKAKLMYANRESMIEIYEIIVERYGQKHGVIQEYYMDEE